MLVFLSLYQNVGREGTSTSTAVKVSLHLLDREAACSSEGNYGGASNNNYKGNYQKIPVTTLASKATYDRQDVGSGGKRLATKYRKRKQTIAYIP